jgi:hypothetical protein
MTRAPSPDCSFIDAEILRLARQQTALDHEIGQWLLLAARATARSGWRRSSSTSSGGSAIQRR